MTTDKTAWVFYGGVPWDSPWLNDQQLAHAMAAHGPVLYVDPPRSPLAGLRASARGRGRNDNRHVLRPRLRREQGVHVLSPVNLPKSRWRPLQRIATPLVRAQVRWAVGRLHLPRVTAAVGMGTFARRLKGAAGEARFIAFVSDWLEAGGDLLDRDRAALARESRALWEAADILCVTSQPLGEALHERGFESHLVPHAFDDGVAARFEAPARPDEYAGAGRPVLAVAGRLNRRLDVELLGELAGRLGEGSIFLIGPMSRRDISGDLEALLRRPNVHHIGARSREELPPYLCHADVLLIPYRSDEWSRYSSPMKVWDYLYAGKPIVGQSCLPLRELGEPLAYDGADRGEVIAAVERALHADSALATRRRAIAAANTWRARADELRALVPEQPASGHA